MLGLGNSLSIGTVPIWTPADLPNLLHWYRYGTGISTYTQTAPTTNVLVTQWDDQKGTNHLIDQSTPSSDNTGGEPTPGYSYNASTPRTDGKSIIWDDAADALLYSDGADNPATLSLGKFAYYVRASTTNDAWNDTITEGSNHNFLKIQDAEQMRFKFTVGAGGQRHDFATPVTLNADVSYNFGWERSSDGQCYTFVDNAAGANSPSGSNDGTEVITNLLVVTQVGDPLAAQTMHEIVICSDVLTSAERILLNTYLNNII